MPKIKSISNNQLIRLQSEVKFYNQGLFLHHVNEIAHEVSVELKKLTQRCEELFGKFPLSISMIDNSPALYFAYDDYLEQPKQWNEIEQAFIHCICKETRENGRPIRHKVLMKNDNELKEANEIERAYKKKVGDYVNKELNENLDALKLEYSDAANIPSEQVTELLLAAWLRAPVYQRLRETDDTYRKAVETGEAKIEKLREFQNDFDTLLESLCLNKTWLAPSVFRAIWNGTGKLQMQSSFREEIPQEVIDEINNRLETKTIFFNTDREEKVTRLAIPNNIPMLPPFVYKAQYLIYDSFEEYEENAMIAYREHLRNYFNIIDESLKKYGYKSNQGNSNKYEGVDWLVLWNYSNFEYLWEIIQQITKFEETDMHNEVSVYKATDIIRKKFEQFEQLDFPIRPWKRNRKK